MGIDTQDIAIDKQQLAQMPTVAFDGQITIIESAEGAEAALRELTGYGIVGFDTETKPSFKKGQVNTVALMQLSTESRCFLIRLNKTGLTEPIKAFLEDEKVVKVGLSLKDDFSVLHRLGDFTPGGFIDLQSMVKNYHISDCSLQKVYGIVFGQRISKSQRLSNWEAPALTQGQCLYASTDAWACLRIYRMLTSGQFEPSAHVTTSSSSIGTIS